MTQTTSARILIVDDEPANVRLLERVLGRPATATWPARPIRAGRSTCTVSSSPT